MASAPGKGLTKRAVTVNTKVVAASVLIDPCARNWITCQIGYRIISSSGITVPAQITFGSNSPNYDNVYGQATAGFQPDGSKAGIIWVPLDVGYVAYADLTTSGLRVNVQVAATGTSQSVEFIVVGCAD